MKKGVLCISLIFVFLLASCSNDVGNSVTEVTKKTEETQVKESTKTQVQEPNVLKGQFHLNNVVKIYVPSTYNIDEPVDNKKYVDQSLEKFSNMFGGATSIDGTGAWIGDNKKLVKEKVTIVYSFAEKLDKDKINKVVEYAKYLKNDMKQSSVSLEVNGKMYFIE
ncbi:DUF3574 domain-containing protein [Priestia endophytica]|jgi:hypothetical protein|uniref:DUF3574 domain-containing protein n=1 Tax=Priestia endophytica TaxID=135735 RepID=UPI001F5B144F|nr:DUF3574 domain-containing protein [Priestia endophytica]